MLSFGDGFVFQAKMVRVTAQVDAIVEAGGTASRVLKWTGPDHSWQSFRLPWNATKISVLQNPLESVFILGADGTIGVGASGGYNEEAIDTSDNGPGGRGPILDLRVIGNHIYVAGMSRQVYRREHDGQWTRQDAGVVLPLGTTDVVALNSIDGLSEKDIYAVGFGGEIWRRRSGTWTQMDSPTKVLLHKVRSIHSNLAYACGQLGVLMRCNDGRWQIINHDATKSDLWGMEWFNNTLYVATEETIYRLNPHDGFDEVNQGLGKNRTYRYLHANDGVLWSFGEEHLAWTPDGATWHDVTP